MIEIVPAIDIIDGKCVRLTKGEYDTKKVYDSSVKDMAMRFADCGVKRIHLVDLDGAKAGKPCNLKELERVASSVAVEIEWGGGISDDIALRDVLNAGATQAIIGSVAALKPEIFHKWLREYGSGKLILGADVKDGNIAVKGWLETTSKSIVSIIEDFLPDGLDAAVCTDISKDGMLQGTSGEFYRDLQEKFPSVCITVSGGISSMKDIEELDALGLRKVITGKAIYEHRISLEEIAKWSQNA